MIITNVFNTQQDFTINVQKDSDNEAYLAKGELSAEFDVGKSRVPVPSTGLPGRNFRLRGFGVS